MNANSGGFDLLNLVMLLGTALAAYSYLRAPNAQRMNTLILMGILLAQSRYESVLYVLAAVRSGCRRPAGGVSERSS